MGHGILMDELLKHMDDKFGMFIDSDVCFLKKNWDTIFIDEINNENLIYLGTKSDDVNRKFPGPYCMFFKTKELKQMNYSTQPVQSVYFEKKYDFGESFKNSINKHTKLKGGVFVLEKDAYIYGLKNGEKTYLDTNSQFNIFFHDMGDKYKLLECYWARDKQAKFLFKKEGQGNEFHLNKEIILTHQGRTHRGWKKDPKNIKWLKQINKWFSKEDLKILFNF